ncbi:MAG TPA: RIP metalloprotease RseP [Syntrophaceae bacterium]|nr:RIP metalloprotease RseP [Syntrophaceae bacterium]
MLGVSIISLIILLGVLIFAHEVGHFLVAKYSGVGVLKFSLGFGPRLIGKKVGETEYLISLIPLGGYVKLLGESQDDELSEEDKKRSFLKQPVSKRIAIVAAGPIFNFLLAIVIFTIVYMIGVPTLTTYIGGVQEGSSAYDAGIKEGDMIIAIDGKEITRWEILAERISKSEGKELRVTIKRDELTRDVSLKPRMLKTQNIFGEEIESYKIGVSPSSQHTVTESMNPLMAFWTGLKQTWNISKLTVLSVIKIFEGAISPKTLGGPILIAQIAGAQVKEGIIPFVFFMALLSINLAILNLFPIPILDGGHLLFFFIEIITGKEINIKWREMAQQIGFVLLVILMLFVFIIDIERLNLSFDNINKIFSR